MAIFNALKMGALQTIPTGVTVSPAGQRRANFNALKLVGWRPDERPPPGAVTHQDPQGPALPALRFLGYPKTREALQ